MTARDDPTAYNTDKERTLFSPSDPFWRTTADQLAEAGVGVNTFLFPDQYTDVASVGSLSAVTGGQTFFHPRFEPVRDRETLFDEIRRTITSELVYNSTLRVRCSNNLRIGDHYGNFYQRSLTDLEFGIIDDGAAVGAVIKYEGKLDEKQLCYLQVAVLHTSSSGERRVRVLNMSMGVTSLIGNVFRFADLDAAITLYTKEGKPCPRFVLTSSCIAYANQAAQGYTEDAGGSVKQNLANVSATLRGRYTQRASELSPFVCSQIFHELTELVDTAGRLENSPDIHIVHAQMQTPKR